MVDKFAVEIFGLGVCFGGEWVLRGFSVSLARGEKVTLTGPSGSGKSTVLRCITGLAVPSEGEVRIFGEAVNGHTVWETRRKLAYVAQEPDLGGGKVKEVIERPFHYRANHELRGNLERLPEMMERFNLSESLLGRDMPALSGGEKQRVALVIAILLDRELILLDEASSALDKKNREAIAEYFQNAGDVTVLSVAHDVEWLGFTDRTVDMREVNNFGGGQG